MSGSFTPVSCGSEDVASSGDSVEAPHTLMLEAELHTFILTSFVSAANQT